MGHDLGSLPPSPKRFSSSALRRQNRYERPNHYERTSEFRGTHWRKFCYVDNLPSVSTRNTFDGSLESLDRYVRDVGCVRLGERACLLADAVRPLLPLCRAEGARRADPEAAYSCVGDALQVVDDLQLALAPGWRPKGYGGRLWQHTDDLPNPNDFQDAHAIDKEALEVAAAAYLSRPWLSSGHLDWVILDALTRNELVAFEYAVQGPQFDISELVTPRWMKWIISGGLGVPIEVALALGIAWWLWRKYASNGPNRHLWAVAAVVYYAAFAIRSLYLTRARHKRAKQIGDTRLKVADITAELRRRHRELRGPVLNPTRIRDLFRSAETNGIVWSTATWPILENAVKRDPGIWVTSQTG